MKDLTLTIGYLYGDYMNTYGDTGNVICLQKRAEWRGIKVKVMELGVGKKLQKGVVDIFFFGGGQDQGQILVGADLPKNKKVLVEEIERGIPLLSVCGGYQLLGEYYRPSEGSKIDGLHIFPSYTEASDDRMIGNIVVKSLVVSRQSSEKNEKKTIETLVGFENHSGKTYLRGGANPLGKVIKGFGNNGVDETEGCIYKNAIGTYMHGSLLPKNPQLADWLLKKTLEIKYGEDIDLEPLDDSLELKAQEVAIKRFG